MFSVGLLASGALSVAQLFHLISQNFMVLYAVSLVAYWRLVLLETQLFRTTLEVVVGVAASLTCLFLLQGFNGWLLVPAGLMALGLILRHRLLGLAF